VSDNSSGVAAHADGWQLEDPDLREREARAPSSDLSALDPTRPPQKPRPAQPQVSHGVTARGRAGPDGGRAVGSCRKNGPPVSSRPSPTLRLTMWSVIAGTSTSSASLERRAVSGGSGADLGDDPQPVGALAGHRSGFLVWSTTLLLARSRADTGCDVS
jgi:hypothetical protein